MAVGSIKNYNHDRKRPKKRNVKILYTNSRFIAFCYALLKMRKKVCMDNGLDEKTKNKIVGIVSVLIPEAKIYLFGSRARGSYKKHSDIDIALDAGKPLPIQDIDEVKSMLNESNILHLIDVLDFHSVNITMQQAIMKEKIVWKS